VKEYFAWKSKQLRERREIAALERTYALHWPHRPPAILLALDVILAILLVFAMLFEWVAVNVAGALFKLPPDFGWCRWCGLYHDLDIACRSYLEEMELGDIFKIEEGEN
jgi:hypothetical protein